MDEVLTINNDNRGAKREELEAQKQWELRGTVSMDYLRQVLGDISQCVSVQGIQAKKEGAHHKESRPRDK